MFPDSLALGHVRPGYLHGATRRVLADPARWTPRLDWQTCPPLHAEGCIGFFQLFDAADPALAGCRPWYDVTYPHAGGCDAHFSELWPRDKWATLPIECLHLGRVDYNWYGQGQADRDLMARHCREYNFMRSAGQFPDAAAKRAGELPGRLEVEGYPPSTYRMPSERQK